MKGREIQPGLTVSARGAVETREIGESRANGEDTEKGGMMRLLTGLISRFQLANMAGLQFGGQRDLYNIFGYKKQLTTADFLAKYIRQDITSRIIDAPPDATWSHPPSMSEETDAGIKDAWEALAKQHDIFGALNRVDRLSRLNHFSILILGLDDGSNLKSPVREGRAENLLFMRAVGSRQVDTINFDSNVNSPRFGLPDTYKIRFDDPTTKSVTSGSVTVKGLKDITVHHSRVVHVVEKPLEDMVFGIPIIEKVYNLLDDLLKVGGGTSEIFWLAANQGLQADIDKDMEIDPADAAALKDELDEFQHQLRRYVRTRGVTLKVLDSKSPNPQEIFGMLLGLISGTTGIPKRILLGSEAGELASAQDRANWAERIDERRALFCEPRMLSPLIVLLQSLGLVPEGEAEWVWPSAFIQNPLEEGQTMAQTARAIGNISRQTGNQTPMQLTSVKEGRAIVGLDGDLKESDILDTEEPEEEPGPGDDEEDTDEQRSDETEDE